jgi:cytochrome c biogenesis protein CcmG, thiol:disulfide interchange protein DsbE
MTIPPQIWKWISFVILAISGIWVIFSTVSIPPATTSDFSAPQIGLMAPEFDLSSLQNYNANLHQVKGKVILINFFASWCPPCKAEMPAMQRVYSTYKSSRLEIFAVTNLRQDYLPDIQNFINASGAKFPILLDQDGKVFQEYAIRALPTTFLIDPSGRILKIFYGGPLTDGLLAVEIERAMEKP